MEFNYRSSGDGIDSSLLESSNSTDINLKFIPLMQIIHSLTPIEPKIVRHVIPKFEPKEQKHKEFLIGKPKEAKFVPYEPYKAAVEPIYPSKKIIKLECFEKVSKNNIDIQELVNQIAEVRASELKTIQSDLENEEYVSKKQWEVEKRLYETDIKNLRETNAHLENNLKFQTQVNSELKTLLVAAVGEDLESRVQHLTEDKLQLARALLKSANHLTNHQERSEWLSGQCEVWRSKFLASSLMIEELAKWKLTLTERVDKLQEIIKMLLHERNLVQKKLLKTYDCLDHSIKKICDNQSTENLTTINILDLSTANCNLSRKLFKNLSGDDKNVKEIPEYINYSTNTPAERSAINLMKSTINIANKPDIVCNALLGAAGDLTGGQLYLQHPAHRATCCAHCKGDFQNV